MLLIKKYSIPGPFVFQILPIIDKFQFDGLQKDLKAEKTVYLIIGMTLSDDNTNTKIRLAHSYIL